MRFANFKILIGALILFSAASCDKPPSGGIDLIVSDSVLVVPGAQSTCGDIRGQTSPYATSLTADSFKITTFKVDWKGSKQLLPQLIRIKFSHPFLQGSPVTCDITSSEINAMFTGDTGISAVLEPSAPSQTAPSSTIYDMNNAGLGAICGFGCGGLKRTVGHETSTFTASGTMDFVGFAQNADGTGAEPIRGTSQLTIKFF